MQVNIPNEILLPEVGSLLREGKDVVIMTKGYSMNPFIVGERDSVLLRRLDSVEPGDIVLAEVSPQRYVLHRIIALEKDTVRLMGDGNISGTEVCGTDGIMGTVIKVLKANGRTICPGKAKLWRKTSPLLRRLVLSFYRRTLLRIELKRKPREQ